MMNRMLGNAVQMDSKKAEKKFSKYLVDNEVIQMAFRMVRDMVIFTNARLIFIDKQGVTGKKTEYLSIPYRSISRFAVESAAHMDLDFELKIWVIGMEKPVKKEFKRGKQVMIDLQKALARYTTRIN